MHITNGYDAVVKPTGLNARSRLSPSVCTQSEVSPYDRHFDCQTLTFNLDYASKFLAMIVYMLRLHAVRKTIVKNASEMLPKIRMMRFMQ